MTDHLSGAQKDLIATIAKEQGIEEFELETKIGGDGSFGYITAVTVKGNNKKLELIVKSASDNEKVRTVNPVRKAYLQEIHVYENLLPAFERFERELGVEDVFCAYPKIYGSLRHEGSECLILENLNENGFKLWDRKIPMNGEHVTLMFLEYAKFHAISFAMSVIKPCAYYDFTGQLTNIFETHSLLMAQTALEYGRKAVLGNHLATEALDRLSAVVEHFVTQVLENPESKIVVVHKDGWCNNMMFKYEDPENSVKPTKVNIIDWQMAEKGPPVLDLSYFLFTCGSTEVILNYAKYLKIYHDALSETLRKLSCDVNELYSFSLLSVQWHKYCKFGLFMALIMIKFMLSEKDEVANISHMARTGMSFVDRLNFESIHEDTYNKRISAIITIMARDALI